MGSKRARKKKSSRRGAPYLGRISTKWCADCGVPIICGASCPNCSKKLVRPKISPPGDVRPAFEHDLNLTRTTCDRTFVKGAGEYLFPPGAIALFNKIGALDDDYQLIMGGKNFGNVRYDIFSGNYIFYPSKTSGALLYKYYHDNGLLDKADHNLAHASHFIKYTLEAEKYLVAGKSVLVPGIIAMDATAKEGDPCVIYTDNGFVATGHYTEEPETQTRMMAESYGRIAKLKYHGEPIPLSDIKHPVINSGLDWVDVAKINESLIQQNVATATRFINRVIDKNQLPIAVAYSGGKDSLVTLLLVRKALEQRDDQKSFSLFFADTGLEFPEVIKNVNDVRGWVGKEISYYSRSIGDKFWDLVQKFGPPARDFRFCCHTLKASQINEIIDEISENNRLAENGKVLVFLGQRRYESFARAEEKWVYTNSYIPRQLAAIPIKNWTALEEWLFMFLERDEDPSIPINPLYFKGHDRLGCYLCPAQSLASLQTVKESHKELYDKWMAFLAEYRDHVGLVEAWQTWGLWRFKQYRGQWEKLAKKAGTIKIKPTSEQIEDEIKLHITKGISPCAAGGFSVKAAFSMPLVLDELLPWVQMVDKHVHFDEDSGLLYLEHDGINMIIYADGTLLLQSTREGFDFNLFLLSLLGSVARAVACQKCGVCVNVCPQEAISQSKSDKSIEINVDRCIGLKCQKCSAHCPVFHLVRGNIIEET